ncbi:hypothetical protein [Nesterenkonia sandarakina]|uniref:Uncharacterized protein n=1 Tax=Nesterenkonia sandarakina TaxID=272918 RepID=A0A7Z0E9E5_9MICC|nr:hypothetical protein [Nesterenkonia sandarakina]NYJ17371.1 hypothetical protein [Nesterenkonia sandarakina]
MRTSAGGTPDSAEPLPGAELPGAELFDAGGLEDELDGAAGELDAEEPASDDDDGAASTVELAGSGSEAVLEDPGVPQALSPSPSARAAATPRGSRRTLTSGSR